MNLSIIANEEQSLVNIDITSLLVGGFSAILLFVTTLTIDETLIPSKIGYWTRFAYFGLRFGISGFAIWCVFVLVVFH